MRRHEKELKDAREASRLEWTAGLVSFAVFDHLVGSRLELLREVLPDVRRLAVMGNAGFPGAVQEASEVRAMAPNLGLEVIPSEIRRADDIAPAFEAFRGRADALYVCGDLLVFTNRIRINTLAAGARMPTLHATREFAEAGGLMSYGVNYVDMFRRAGDYIDKILRGTKAADLPVEQPTRFELVINLTTAKALGLTVSPTMLARANEVIERRRCLLWHKADMPAHPPMSAFGGKADIAIQGAMSANDPERTSSAQTQIRCFHSIARAASHPHVRAQPDEQSGWSLLVGGYA